MGTHGGGPGRRGPAVLPTVSSWEQGNRRVPVLLGENGCGLICAEAGRMGGDQARARTQLRSWVPAASSPSQLPPSMPICQFSSVQSLSRVRLFANPWTTAHQASSLSITNARNLPKLMSIESVMPSNHLILCRPLLLLPSIFPGVRVFSNESRQVAKKLEFQLQHQSFQ